MTATAHRSAGRKTVPLPARVHSRHRRDSSFTAHFADGPLGPGGVEIRNCGASGAHPTYCQDDCGGYEGELPDVDNYKYRYYITGKVNDLNSLPSYPKPDDLDLYFPFTIRCHRGKSLSSVSTFKNYAGSDGFTSDHTGAALAGYSTPVAVQCLDGDSYTDYGFTEAVITPVGDPTLRPTPAPVEDPTPPASRTRRHPSRTPRLGRLLFRRPRIRRRRPRLSLPRRRRRRHCRRSRGARQADGRADTQADSGTGRDRRHHVLRLEGRRCAK